MKSFEKVQRGLPDALNANRPGSRVDHALVVLPSYSLGESLLSHYADRIPALEHRFLVSVLLLHRMEHCHLIFVASRRPEPEVIDYYGSLLGDGGRELVRRQLHVCEVPDLSARSVAAKLLERPDLLADIRRLVGGRPALIEPWNVTSAEVEVSRRIEVPINGTSPELWSLGFKSEGRRLFREGGVPVATGVEDVRSVDDVLRAMGAIRDECPDASAVVVKLDDSGAGDGNVVLDLEDPEPRRTLEALPDWYLHDLAAGSVVEARVTGTRFSSPSAQIDILPGGDVVVLATHEQVLGGADDQVYLGCRFPADPAYAATLARHAVAAGEVLGARGVLGRVSVDFAVVQDSGGRWACYALEVNLRKGGTTHPYTALRNLVPGRYDVEGAQWTADDGTVRAYSATDNLVDPAWICLTPDQAIGAVQDAGIGFDPSRGTGVVLHMLSGLAIDGRLGLTAIGADAGEAAALQSEAALAIDRAAPDRPDGDR